MSAEVGKDKEVLPKPLKNYFCKYSFLRNLQSWFQV